MSEAISSHSSAKNPRTGNAKPHRTRRRKHPKNHPRSRALTKEDIRKTARATALALAASNLDCCLFGSAACSMYGMSRVPNVSVGLLTPNDPGI